MPIFVGRIALRLFVLVRRLIVGLKCGVLFYGTSRFVCPDQIRANGNLIDLRVPKQNHGVHTDFVNIILDDEYGLRTLDDCETILDVGANVGLFSLWAGMRFPRARIIAVEPNPQAIEFLTHNAFQLDVDVHSVALGLTDGHISISGYTDITCCQVERDSEGSVALVRFCDFISQVVDSPIDLLKMDCEGFEWELLKDRDALCQVKRIHLEYHLVDNRTITNLEQMARDAGFKIDRLFENRGFGIAYLTQI